MGCCEGCRSNGAGRGLSGWRGRPDRLLNAWLSGWSLYPRCRHRRRSAPSGESWRRRSLWWLADLILLGEGREPGAITWTRTVLPVGMTSMVALPSGSVLTSRLPSSLPSIVESKMTAAFMMGLPLNFLTTVTSMCEVGGGSFIFAAAFYGRVLSLSLSWEAGCEGQEENEKRERPEGAT